MRDESGNKWRHVAGPLYYCDRLKIRAVKRHGWWHVWGDRSNIGASGHNLDRALQVYAAKVVAAFTLRAFVAASREDAS